MDTLSASVGDLVNRVSTVNTFIQSSLTSLEIARVRGPQSTLYYWNVFSTYKDVRRLLCVLLAVVTNCCCRSVTKRACAVMLQGCCWYNGDNNVNVRIVLSVACKCSSIFPCVVRWSRMKAESLFDSCMTRCCSLVALLRQRGPIATRTCGKYPATR